MDRKAKIRQYKETPLVAGVFRVRNRVRQKSLVGSSTNLPGMLNRQRFQLERGSHPNRDLQQDWNESGPESFTFEALDRLEPADAPDRNESDELRVLVQLWMDKLREGGEQFYGKH